jgi:amino acid adenylation domain-containing protein/thioester reductase-like protein
MTMDRANIADIYKLTSIQEGMLFHSLSKPDSGVYVEQFAQQVPFGVDSALWQAAWNRVITHHDILRSGFFWEGLEKPVQVVHRRAEIEVEHMDWSALPEQERNDRLQALRAADWQTPFDLSKAPSMRLRLIRTAPEATVLLWTYHHILLDGWSAFIVLDQALQAYLALADGREPILPPSTPYKNYLRWLGQQDRLEAENFWRQYLAGFGSATPLGLVEENPGLDSGADYAIVRRSLGQMRAERLRQFAREARLTVNTLIQGAYGYLLGLYSGEDDVVFGCTVSGRPPALENSQTMVGLFINTLPLRVRIQAGRPVCEWLRELQDNLVALRSYEHSPLVDIQGCSPMGRGLPLFDSMLAVESFPQSNHVQLPDVTVSQKTNYPLTLVVEPAGDMNIRAMFDPRRYAPATVERFLDHWETVLDELMLDAERPLGLVSAVSAAEQRRQAVWNATAADFPRERDVARLFAEQAERTPQLTAVAVGDARLSYAELEQRANSLAHYLLAQGAEPGGQIALLMEPSLELIVAILAVIKTGNAYAPLDPKAPSARLAGMLAELRFKQLLSHRGLADLLAVDGLDILDLDECAADWVSCSTAPPPVRVDTRQLFYVIHTSGSTGKPKAAGVYHDSFVNLITWWNREFGFGCADKCLLINKITFDLAQKNVWGALLTGGELHLAVGEHFDPEYVRRTIASQGITWINCTPSMGYALVEGEDVDYRDLTTLRYLLLGGEPVNKARLAPWLLSEHSRCELVNTYGPTECADLCTTHRFTRNEFEDLGLPVTVGKNLPNIHMLVLDRFNNPLPTGIAGEVMIGGVSLGVGYLNNPGLTATQFIPHPQPDVPGERLYRTGDLGYFRDDGSIIVKGRVDFQVKIRGYRIELEEIDAVLRLHAEVQDAVTVVAGGDHQQLVSYVVPVAKVGENLAAFRSALREHLAQRLPDYMVPSIFVLLEAIPLNVNGKVDRAALPEADDIDAVQAGEIQAPGDDVEEALLAVWQKVLGRDDIGVHDNFFALGGHSLSITQIFSRIPKVFEVKLGLSELFENPTIAGQAALIRTRRNGNAVASYPPLTRRERPDPLPLSYAQSRLWFVQEFAPDNPAYNVPNAVLFDAPANIEALLRALLWLTRRHESLRTRFPSIGGEPRQEILEDFNPPFEIEDLTLLPAAEREPRAGEIATLEAQTPFDLADAPPVRYRLLVDEGNAVLLATLHHIVTDGWSTDIFVRELRDAYAAYQRGGEPELPELALQYADYALWQRDFLSGEVRERQVAYWRGELASSVDTISLPYDFPRPAQLSWQGGLLRTEYPPELVQALKTLAEKQGATLFTTLMAAFELLLFRWSGQDDFVVGTPIANRHMEEIEPVIGFFVNTLPLRARMDGDQSFLDLLAAVKRGAHAAYEHQDLPFEVLVDELKPARSAAYNPFFQVCLALRNAYENMALIDSENWVARWDLYAVFSEQDGLTGQWEFSRDVFRPETIQRLADSFAVLLPQLVADPDKPLVDYDLLNAQGTAATLALGKGPQLDLGGRLFTDLFMEQVRERPEAMAIWHQDTGIGYGELNRRANRLAHFLIRLGAASERRVGLCLERGPDWIVSILAVLKTGAAYVPLDPNYPAERLQFMLEDSDCGWLIAHSHIAEHIPLSSGIRVLVLDGERLREAIELESAADPDNIEILPEHLAYIIYTSGSTGRPKGTLIEHRNLALVSVALAQRFDFRVSSRMLQFASFSFDASVWEWAVALAGGGRLCMAAEEAIKSPERLAAFVAGAGTTHALLPPSLLAYLDRGKLACLDHLLVGGEGYQQALAEAWSPNRRFFNAYGPTETTVICMAADYHPGDAKLTLGHAVANTELFVLDGKQRPVPVGVPGELCIGGAGVCRGYLNRPELNSEKFIAHPFRPDSGERLYRTGDLVRWLDDGSIEFLGRIDHQVKIRGFRIELGEIEARLMEHPRVSDAVVLAREIATGNPQLLAYVLSDGAGDGLREELMTGMRESLPHFMVPMAVIAMPAWPMTPNGKIDRRALPSPVEADMALRVGEPPRSERERWLIELWREILDVEAVGATDDFFALGGHSLSATKLMARVREESGRSMPLKDFFVSPTVRSMAAYLETDDADRETDEQAAQIMLPPRPVALDEESAIMLPTPLPPQTGQLRHVLLTGVTGFVGAYLLEQMLERWPGVTVHCLVRADSQEDGMRRIRANLEQYGLWWDGYASRIKVVIGDLARPDLGIDGVTREYLASEIDLILHNGSYLNHVLRYGQLSPANVGSTKALLELAAYNRLKRFVYVSTAGVFNAGKPGRTKVDEDTDLHDEGHTDIDGYNATKWVAEEAVRKAGELGLPFQIFRLGRVVVDSGSGAGRIDDFVGLYLRTCIQLGVYPDYPMIEKAVPVDYAARAIVALAGQPASGEIFHLIGEESYDWSKLLSRHVAGGVGLKRIRADYWVDRVKQASVDTPLPFAPYLFYWDTDQGAPDRHRLHIEQKKTQRRLAELDLPTPRIDRDAWERFIERLFEAEGRDVVFKRRGWY